MESRGDALAAFIANYTALMNLWDWSLQATSDTKMKVRLQGVKAVMSTFEFLFKGYLIFIIPKVQKTDFTMFIQKKIHRQLYFETFDNIINCIKDHFNQTDYQIVYIQVIKAFKEQDWEDDLQIVIQNYGFNEFDVPSLETQLLLLPEIAKLYGLDSRMQLSEMIALFQKLDIIKRMLVAEVIKLVKIILVMPATNAVSKRSFSSLKELKLIFAPQQQIIG